VFELEASGGGKVKVTVVLGTWAFVVGVLVWFFCVCFFIYIFAIDFPWWGKNALLFHPLFCVTLTSKCDALEQMD